MHATGDEARLERQLVTLRWLVAAFGAAQIGFAVRDRSEDPVFALPLGLALALGLVAGNLLISRSVGRLEGSEDRSRAGALGAVAFGLDAVVLLGLVWLATDGNADPVWVIGYLIPLEGAARWGLRGALLGASLFLGGQVLREVDLPGQPGLHVGIPTLAFRGGMAFIVGAVAGSFGSSLRWQAALAEERAMEAEAAARSAAASADRERQARREVAAFHAAVLAEAAPEDLGPALQATADAIARELGCQALGLLVREQGQAGGIAFLAAGVHGDPGYLKGQRLAPLVDPVAAAAVEGEPVMAGRDAVAPMKVQGEVVGVLHEQAAPGSSPDQERLNLLTRLGDQIGLVLESARLRTDQEATVKRLRELDEMKTDFVAITSHELRTPLAGVRGFVDMLRRRGDELSAAEREEFLDIVLTQTNRLVALVDDLLVVTRLEAGKLSLEPVDIDIAAFLGRLVRVIGNGDANIHLVPGEHAPSRMLVDENRLAQILTNLISNAVKFSPAGSRVEVGWESPAEGTVAFSVADRGPGISDSELSRIFERFHQTERHTSHTEGFGLGLYITKLLTQAMGGWIDVRSKVGVGSTFTVTLPATRGLPEPARPSAAGR
jgi:signal transduction histidine kinase